MFTSARSSCLCECVCIHICTYIHGCVLLMSLWGGQKASSILPYPFLPHLLELNLELDSSQLSPEVLLSLPSIVPESQGHTEHIFF